MASVDWYLKPGLQLPPRLDFVQDAVGKLKIAVGLRLDRNPDLDLRVHAGERLGKGMDLVGEVLDFRDAQDCQARCPTSGWRLCRRRLRWLRRRAADHQFSCAVVLQRTDRAASARAVNEALTQRGIDAVQEELRRPRTAAPSLQFGVERGDGRLRLGLLGPRVG